MTSRSSKADFESAHDAPAFYNHGHSSRTAHYIAPFRSRSPTSSLRHILTHPDAANDLSKDEALVLDSFRVASDNDLNFAQNVLNASSSLKDWSDELHAWKWSGGFESLDVHRPTVFGECSDCLGNEQEEHSHNLASDCDGPEVESSAEKYSLLNDRLDAISLAFEKLDFTGMKNRALADHLSTNPGVYKNLQTDHVDSKQYAKIDNFMALAVVVLLQALPHHSQISTLIDTWNARFAVMKLIPRFESHVFVARHALDQAWGLIGLFSDGDSDISRTSLAISEVEIEQTRADLQSNISSVGRILDSMLDLLEGLPDSVPEPWIDEAEFLEEEYSEWTMAVHNIMVQWEADEDQGSLVTIATQSKTTDLIETDEQAMTFLEPATSLDTLNDGTISRSNGRVITNGQSDLASLVSQGNDLHSSHPTTPGQTARPVDRDLRDSSFLYDSDDSAKLSSGEDNLSDKAPVVNEAEDFALDDSRGLSNEPAPSTEMHTSEMTVEPLDSDTRADGTNHTKRTQSSSDEQIDRKIDSILTTLPARIEFKRKPSERLAAHRSITPEYSRSSRPTSPSFTLMAAESRETRAAKYSGDSPIRLYYLSQADRQKPIKLFVRLVGENGERVMVRVGGGWANLAEYLREYATHHSRTIIPSPNEQLQAVDLSKPGNSRVFSLPTAWLDSSSSSSPPPDTSNYEERTHQSVSWKASQPNDGGINILKRRPGSRSLNRSTSLERLSQLAESPQSHHGRSGDIDQDISYLQSETSNSESNDSSEVVPLTQSPQDERTCNLRSSRSPTSLSHFEVLGKVGNTKRVFRVSDGVWRTK